MPERITYEEIYAALSALCARIEACGASIALTNAVILCSDIKQAVGNEWNAPDAYATDRIRKDLRATDALKR